MSETYDKIRAGLDDLLKFSRGEGGSLTLHIPDGKGGMTKRTVHTMAEYAEVMIERGLLPSAVSPLPVKPERTLK